MEHGGPRAPGRLAAGAAAGALAALAMVVFMAAAAAWDGDVLGPLRAAGTAFRGTAALDGPATIAWGLVLHLVVGVGLGTVYALVLPSDFSTVAAVVLGAGCALVLMGLAMAIVVPVVAPVLAAAIPRHGGAWVIAHAVFGAVAGTAPALRRRFGARRGGRRGLPLEPRTARA